MDNIENKQTEVSVEWEVSRDAWQKLRKQYPEIPDINSSLLIVLGIFFPLSLFLIFSFPQDNIVKYLFLFIVIISASLTARSILSISNASSFKITFSKNELFFAIEKYRFPPSKYVAAELRDISSSEYCLLYFKLKVPSYRQYTYPEFLLPVPIGKKDDVRKALDSIIIVTPEDVSFDRWIFLLVIFILTVLAAVFLFFYSVNRENAINQERRNIIHTRQMRQ